MDKQIFNQKVIPRFSLTLMIASIGVFIGFFIPPILYIPIMIAEFAILIATFWFRKQRNMSSPLLYFFVLLTGITTTPIVAWAGHVGGAGIVLQALGITTLVFFSLSYYVYTTGRDFRSIGTFLMFALLGAILASVVNMFLGNALFSIILDVIVLIIFLGFVMYDMSKILRDYNNEDVNIAVLSLYLDFLNIFIRILHLLVLSKRRN